MVLLAFAGAGLVILVLWDGFETVVLPRRVDKRVRISRLFYRVTWSAWRRIALSIGEERNDGFLGLYGPLSVILLFLLWFGLLIFGFGMLLYGINSKLALNGQPIDFATTLYMSGTNFFTLGIGDVTPNSPPGRAVTVVETGTGFGFLALVISYMPVIYQSFSRREVNISLLDARAGSPPTAGEILRRYARGGTPAGLHQMLLDWERWAADILESHISYPIVAYFRSQHERQSWLAALAAITDFCSLLIVCGDEQQRNRGLLTFAMSRHAAVYLLQVFRREMLEPPERLTPADLAVIESIVVAAGLQPLSEGERILELGRMRRQYEPYMASLAEMFLMPLPPFVFAVEPVDDWRTSEREPVGH